MKLFTPWPANRFASPICERDDHPFLKLLDKFNAELLSKQWLSFSLKWMFHNSNSNVPTATTFYFPGVLGFADEAPAQKFLEDTDDIEWLPIDIEGKPWVLLNCLRRTSGIDWNESKFMREPYSDGQPNPEGKILLINWLVINDARALNLDVFTVSDGPQLQLVVTERFMKRFNALGLKGLKFKPIGHLVNHI